MRYRPRRRRFARGRFKMRRRFGRSRMRRRFGRRGSSLRRGIRIGFRM